MSKARDDFSSVTVRLLRERAGNSCSKPDCRVTTLGPNSQPDKTTNIGVGAHITAASKGGPRHDKSLLPKQRSHYDNGIWLCEIHAKEIDVDVNKYPVDLLKQWKVDAENRADLNLGKPLLSKNEADSFAIEKALDYAMNNVPEEFTSKVIDVVNQHDHKLSELDSRFKVKTEIKDGLAISVVSPAENPVSLLFTIKRKHQQQLSDLYNHGNGVSLPFSDVSIGGSALFNHIIDSADGKGTIQIAARASRMDCELLVINNESEYSVGTFKAEMTSGSKSITVKATGFNGFFSAITELKIDKSVNHNYTFSPMAWANKDILKIPYFPRLQKMMYKLMSGWELAFEVSLSHSEPLRIEFKQSKKTKEIKQAEEIKASLIYWIKYICVCRDISSKLRKTIIFNANVYDMDNLDYLEEIVELLDATKSVPAENISIPTFNLQPSEANFNSDNLSSCTGNIIIVEETPLMNQILGQDIKLPRRRYEFCNVTPKATENDDGSLNVDIEWMSDGVCNISLILDDVT